MYDPYPTWTLVDCLTLLSPQGIQKPWKILLLLTGYFETSTSSLLDYLSASRIDVDPRFISPPSCGVDIHFFRLLKVSMLLFQSDNPPSLATYCPLQVVPDDSYDKNGLLQYYHHSQNEGSRY